MKRIKINQQLYNKLSASEQKIVREWAVILQHTVNWTERASNYALLCAHLLRVIKKEQ